MIVRSVERRYGSLPEAYIEPSAGFGADAVAEDLRVGEEYVVYAITASSDRVRYFVWTDDEVPYPYAMPAPFFEIIDPTPSRFWQLRYDGTGNRLVIAFKEWFEDPSFFDKLTDWEEREAAVFRDVKARMDAEAASRGRFDGHELSEAELAAMKARCEAAGAGPWTSRVKGRDTDRGSYIETPGEEIFLAGASDADQDFIAAARRDVPLLIAEIERLRSLLANR